MTASLYSNLDVELGKALLSKNKDRLKDFEAQNLGLHQFQRNTIYLDEAFSLFAVGQGGCGFLEMK